MTKKLKNCPFCNSDEIMIVKNDMYVNGEFSDTEYGIYCDGCDIEVKNPGLTMHDLIELWNERGK